MRYHIRLPPAWPEEGFTIVDAEGGAYRLARQRLGTEEATVIEDASGRRVAKMHFPESHGPYVCEILHDGKRLLVSSDTYYRRIRYHIAVRGRRHGCASVLAAQGNILRDDYVVRRGLRRLATVKRKGTVGGEALSVETVPGADHVVLLSIVLAISVITRSQRSAALGAGGGTETTRRPGHQQNQPDATT
jgi:uncharacterized protein YxjI